MLNFIAAKLNWFIVIQIDTILNDFGDKFHLYEDVWD